ncbi:MAG: hypothetical protein WC692_11890 [Erythrobacter sp.]|jgi:O-antigen/teichoic acid export membrane protein
MPGSAQRRLIQAILSYLMGIATRIAVQLATLPILFAHWSAERVGTWMLVFALPSYFVVAGAAFASAGGNLALAAAHEDRWDEARAAFRASWVWATLFSLAIAGLSYAVAGQVPDATAREAGLSGTGELRACSLWLGIYVAAIAQGSVMLVPLRVGGRYPQYYTSQNLAGLAEIAVLAACVPQSGSFEPLAIGLAMLRVAVALLSGLLAWRASPAMFSGAATALGHSLRAIVIPSAAFMILPMVYVLNLQGYTLIVGAIFGAKMVAGFVATRVIVRAIDLVMSVVYASQFNEAGYLREEKRELQRRQLATMTSLTLVGILGFSAIMLLAGPWLQHLLTAGKSSFDPLVAVALLVSGLIRALATTPQALVAAENKHGRMAAHYLVASLACLPIAAGLALAGMPLTVVLLMLVPAELAQTLPAFRAALHQLAWSRRDLLRALVHPDRLTDLVQLARFIGRRR